MTPGPGPAVLLRWRRTNAQNGTTRYAEDLGAALRRLGADVRDSHPLYAEARLGRLRLGGRASLAVGERLPRVSRRVVHALQPYENPPGVPADVVTVHDVMPLERPDLYALSAAGLRRWRRRLERAARRSRIVAVSRTTRDALLRHVPRADEARVLVIHHGIDPVRFHPDAFRPAWLRHALRPGLLNVALVLNAERRKRIDVALDVARRLPFVNVLHAGSLHAPRAHQANVERAQADRAVLEQDGRYHAVGGLDAGGLRALLSHCDVVLHPSEAEGFGLPPLEALACGAAVLASDVPAHREVLGDAARLVPLDADAIAGALQDAWDGEALRPGAFPPREARLAHAARYTWERSARAHLGVYAQVTKAGPLARLRSPA